VLAHRLHFFRAFVRLEICLCYDLCDLLAKFQKDGVGMVMRAHAAMSPMVTFRTGIDIDERQVWFLLEPTRVSWRYWLYNTTYRTTLPTTLESILTLEAYPTAPDARDFWSATLIEFGICDANSFHVPRLWVSERETGGGRPASSGHGLLRPRAWI
jgi:hypothetical protein